MANTEFTLSALIESQLPDFINAKYAENAPSFRRFIELYYEWLENSAAGNTVYHIMNAEKYRDIDETDDQFLLYFKQELLPFFPERTELELSKILKGAKDFYLNKGTAASIKWLFRVLYNKEANITIPKDNILRVSDGKWQKPVALKVSDSPFVVQTAETTRDLYAANAAPVSYHTQNTFTKIITFQNNLRRDSTAFIFTAYKIWVQSSQSSATLRNALVNYININPSTEVRDASGKYQLVERTISDDLTGYGTNQHGFLVVECHYKQDLSPQDKKINIVNHMTPSILEAVFGSSSGSTLFQFDGARGFEICQLNFGEPIASNSAYQTASISTSTNISIDGSNTPAYILSFGYSPDISIYFIDSEVITGGTSALTGTDVVDGGEPSTTVFDDTIDGGLYYSETGLAFVAPVIPDSVNNSVISDSPFGDGRYALQFTKKYREETAECTFTSSQASNVATISIAFKQRPSVNLSDLAGKFVLGETSRARAIIEKAFIRVDEFTKTRYTEIFLSNSEGDFINNELIYVDVDGFAFTERILGFVNSLKINPNYRGLRYKINDPVAIYGGFVDSEGNSPSAGFSYATGIVKDATAGKILSLELLKGGYAYREDPNTTVSVIAAEGDPAITRTAVVKVSGVDTGNTITLSLNTDRIAPYAGVQLSTVPFDPSPVSWGTGFPSFTNANVNTVLSDCLGFADIDFYPITSLSLEDEGQGYLSTPTLDFNTFYPISGGLANVTDLGLIAYIEVLEGGENYANGETIIFSGGGGTAATAEVVVDVDGAITEVNITSRGYGYTSRPTATVDTVAGTGASFVVYLFNDGVEYRMIVDSVGKILELELTNSGFGYINEPNVSLRVMDVYTDNLTSVFSKDQELTVYQGTDIPSSTFRANVDIGYVSSINQSGAEVATIRLYEYNGVIDTLQPLKFLQSDVHLNLIGSLTYGNGLAKANLRFIDGTVTYPGFYLNNDGFLSSDKKLQDGYKYHNFSYVLESDKQLREYDQTIKNIAHPAGTQLIAHTQISDVFSFESNISHGDRISESGRIITEAGDYITAEDGNYLIQE